MTVEAARVAVERAAAAGEEGCWAATVALEGMVGAWAAGVRGSAAGRPKRSNTQ